MEDCIDLVPFEAGHDLTGVGDVALVEGEIRQIVEHAGVIERRTVVQLVKGYDIIRVGIRQGQVPDKPASADRTSQSQGQALWLRIRVAGRWTYMNPAPPVIMMFFTSGKGSNLVLPMKTGASFHMPGSPNELCRALVFVTSSPVSYASGSGWVAVIHQPLGRPFGRPFEWPFA